MKKDQSLQQACGAVVVTAAAAKAQWIAHNLKPGEVYAGIILGLDGQPDHHLILLPGEAEKVTWGQAKKFATDAGGELPTRPEQALLYANLKHEFKPNWYWSGEQHAADGDYAWGQYFGYGDQNSFYVKSASLRARAVRRLTIQ
jgi:hypothetical protein